MPLRLFRLLAVAMLLASFPAAFGLELTASSAWSCRSWQTDEGLPDNSVTGVAQTPDGYLWVATYGGLMRFNGANFAAIPLPAIFNKSAHTMLMDHEGGLWLGMDSGAVVNLKSDGAHTFTSDDGLTNELIGAMAEDGQGGIWVIYSSIHSSALCRIKDGRVSRFTTAEGLPEGIEAWVATDTSGDLWFSKGGQVGVFRDGKLQVKLSLTEPALRICGASASGLWICAGSRLLNYKEGHDPRELAQLPQGALPQALFQDRSGALWIGTMADGLFRFKDGQLGKIPTSQLSVDCINEDEEENIWAGTRGGGLNLIRPSAVQLIGRENGLPLEAVASVCVDTQGAVWVVGQSGALSRYQNGKWETLGTNDGWTGDMATCVAADRKSGVWIGSRGHTLYYCDNSHWQTWQRNEGLHTGSVHLILVTSNDDVWVITGTPSRLQQLRGGKIIATFDLPEGNRIIRAMAEGPDGTIWIGTLEGQVLRVAGQSLVREIMTNEPAGSPVRALEFSPDGALWIGYSGAGLGRLKDGKFACITTAEGLADDFASQLLSDDHDGLWIVGNRGLFRVRLDELSAVADGKAGTVRSLVFGRNEGLPNFQPNTSSFPNACNTGDGRLWFATRSGLLLAQPGHLHDNPVPPQVVLERIAIDDRTVALYDGHSPLRTEGGDEYADLNHANASLHVPPGNHKVEFDFAALSFSSPENVQFRYRLSDFDEKWIEAGSLRKALYPRLTPGHYQFQVIACNNAGVWNDTGASINLIVSPFFWQQWWFRTLWLLLFTATVVAIVRYVSFQRLHRKMKELEQQAAVERERSRIARDMHDEVGAKLTRLSLLSEMAGSPDQVPSTTRDNVREISETARETIRSFEEIVWAVNPRNDTLPDLVHYLCRYAEDYFEGYPVQCTFDLPPEIPPLTLPTEIRHQVFLAAKEALNNVLKHSRANHVRVHLKLGPNEFQIIIADDGCGFDPASPPKRAGGGNGLENMRERMRVAGGRFECESTPGRGASIVFHIPCSLPVVV